MLLTHVRLKLFSPFHELQLFLLLLTLDSLDLFQEHISECLMELDSIFLTGEFFILNFLEDSHFSF